MYGLYKILREDFPDYFSGVVEGVKHYRQIKIETEMFYANLIRKVAKSGGVTYNELRYKDIREFFIIVKSWEMDNG
jgi:hypothetical protein